MAAKKKSSRSREAAATIGDLTTTVPAKGNFIRAWRLYRKIPKQETLASMANVRRPTLSRLENGGMKYRQDIIERLATALACTPKDLIGTDPNNMGDVFEIYAKLDPSKREAALHYLKGLSA